MIRGAILVSLLAAGFMLSFELVARGGVLDTTTASTETVTTQASETTSPTTSTVVDTTTQTQTTSRRRVTTTTPWQVYRPPQVHSAVVRPTVVLPPHAATTARRESAKPPARRAVQLPRASVITRPSLQLITVSPAQRDTLRRALVAAGFGVALLLFGVGALPADAVRPRTAALFLYERRILFVLAGAAVFAAAGLAALLGR
jgi:hypothetical protein